MDKNLVIFDCDGVLVDSEWISSEVFSEALSRYGYSITVEESIKRFTGVNEHACREIIMKESSVDIATNYWDLAQPNLIKAYENRLKPLLSPLLDLLNQLNVPRCVASNSSRKHVLNCLEVTKQSKYFTEQSIFTSQQVSKPKPSPDLFLFAAKEMGVDPKNCIVIEDSATGANAAIAAGMQVLMFLGGSHARFEWYRHQIATYNKPMFSTAQELFSEICRAFQRAS